MVAKLLTRSHIGGNKQVLGKILGRGAIDSWREKGED